MVAPSHGHHRLPQYGAPKKTPRQYCLKCICCCYFFLFVMILFLGGLTFFLYMEYQPEIPKYKVNSMAVKSFYPDPRDLTINVDFTVYAEANNPNKHISFKYGENSLVEVWYKSTKLCTGKLPTFEQGTKNVTIMNIDMTGKTGFGNDLQDALQENIKSGQIPILVTVKAPVSVVLRGVHMREFTVHVKCHLVIDSLFSGKKPSIVSSTYDVKASF